MVPLPAHPSQDYQKMQELKTAGDFEATRRFENVLRTFDGVPFSVSASIIMVAMSRQRSVWSSLSVPMLGWNKG